MKFISLYEISTFYILYLLTYSMVQNIIRKADCHSSYKKYPVSLWNPKIHYRVQKRPPLDPILSQLNRIRHIDTYLPKV
jgi:hypothetical protein